MKICSCDMYVRCSPEGILVRLRTTLFLKGGLFVVWKLCCA